MNQRDSLEDLICGLNQRETLGKILAVLGAIFIFSSGIEWLF